MLTYNNVCFPCPTQLPNDLTILSGSIIIIYHLLLHCYIDCLYILLFLAHEKLVLIYGKQVNTYYISTCTVLLLIWFQLLLVICLYIDSIDCWCIVVLFSEIQHFQCIESSVQYSIYLTSLILITSNSRSIILVMESSNVFAKMQEKNMCR